MKTIQIYEFNGWLLVSGINFMEVFKKAKEILKDKIETVELVYSGELKNLEGELDINLDMTFTLLECVRKEKDPDKKLILIDIIKEKLEGIGSILNARIGENI